MKKKLYAIYALVGALAASPVFTSCVDDTESQSVTELRGAKAEQLKSIAALNNAKAQAEITLANAEAALKAAQAAQEQALADKAAAEAAYQEALAKAQELQNQLKEATYDAELEAALAKVQAELAQAQANKLFAEKQIAQYQADMEKAALSLQKELAILEKQLLEAQKDLLQAEKDLADKKDQLSKDELAEAEAKYQELKNLTSQYGNLLIAYTAQSQLIASQEADLSAAQAELADWENLIAEDIAEKETQIKVAQIQIDALKQYTNYTEDIDAMKIELQELTEAYKLAQDKANAEYKEFEAIDIATLKAENKIDELKLAIEETNLYKLYNWDLPGAWMVYQANPITEYYYKEFTIEKEDNIYYSWDYAFSSDSLFVELEYQDVRSLELDVQNYIESINIEGQKKAIEEAETGLQAVYDAAVKATTDAKKAYDEATEAEKATAEQTYKDALSAEEIAKNNLDNAIAQLEISEEEVENIQTAYTVVSDPKAAEDFLAAVDAYNKAIVEIHTQKAEAYFEYLTANETATEAEIAMNTLNAVYNGSGNGNNWGYISLYDLLTNSNYWVYEQFGFSYDGYWSGMDIDYLNNYALYITYKQAVDESGAIGIDEAIKGLEESIKTMTEEIEDLKDVTNKESAIEMMEVQLTVAKANLEAAKLELDALKAKVDALQAELTAE